MVTAWSSLGLGGLVLSLLGSFPDTVPMIDAVKYSIAILELVNQSTSAWVNAYIDLWYEKQFFHLP